MTTIDLARLSRPEIPGLLLTVDEAHAALLDWLRTEHQWVVRRDASDPAWRLTRLWAARESMLRQAIADTLAQGSLAYATGAHLDHIGTTYYSLERLDGEDDDRYRERLSGALERYAVGLSGPWYEQVARGIPGVADARVTTPAAGTVRITILADGALLDDQGDPRYADGIPTMALLEAVTAAVTAPEARQQTDTVQVRACARQRYDVTATLTLFSEPDSATVLAEARAGLAALARRADRLAGRLDSDLIAGATVNPAAVSAATITLQTVDAQGAATDVAEIATADDVAPLARNLTVETA